jgi:hypothetical protein
MPAQSFENFSGSPRLRAVRFADESLERSDGDRPVGSDKMAVVVRARDFSAAAGKLARRAADPAADRRKGIRASGDEISAFEIAVRYRAHVAASVGMHGAGDLTGD